jgi:hypothetical protein
MTRHRTLVRLSRALRVVAVAVAGAAATTVLFEAEVGRGLAMPAWKVATAPPMLYLALALVGLRRLPPDRRIGWALAACGVNVALALTSAVTLSLVHPMSLEGALLRTLWTYVPAPIIHLVAAPLVMLAWRSRLVPARSALRAQWMGSAPLAARLPEPARSAAAPNWDSVLRLSRPSARAARPGPTSFGRAGHPRAVDSSEPEPPAAAVRERPEYVPQPIAFTPEPPSVPRPAPPPPPRVERRPPPPMPTSVATRQPPVADEPVVRIPFARIAAQLPPTAFLLPPERLAESLREPHVLLVPQRLVLPQLGEGAVEIAWALIEDQFPELAFAAPPAEMRQRFAGWVLSLPMDEVVRQIPTELWRREAPAADLSEIGQFPAPFNPGPPIAEAPAAPEPPAVPDPAVVTESPVAAEPSPPAAITISEPPPPAPVAVTAGEPPVVAVAAPPVPGRTPAPAVAMPAAPTFETDESEALARTLALGLTPLGAFDWRTRRPGGGPLVCFVPPTLVREPIDALAARAAALIERLAPWAVEQMTIRTSRVACVLTPLGSRGCLVAAVRRHGPVAMLELLSARAGRATGAMTAIEAPGEPTAVTTVPAEEGNGHRRLGEAARALAAFGAVTVSVASAEGAAPDVYVFAERDGGVLAAMARAVHEALVAGHDEAALGRLESIDLRRGRERAVVRPLRAQPGAPALLAAAGQVALAGRAHRAVARAAALLEAR